jgi:hypothetical protein
VGTVYKVTGSGNILNKVVNFGLKIDDIPSGQMNYQDDEQGIHLISDAIDSFTYDPSTNEVTFTGRGHIDRDVVFFTVRMHDNDSPGTSDGFSISITGARSSTRSGTLTQGNIVFHR